MKNFSQIIHFVSAKELPRLIQQLVTCLQLHFA